MTCYYAGRAINPQCCACKGKDKKCPGYIEKEEFRKEAAKEEK